MPRINSTEFGSITIDGVKLSQVLIVADSVEEREYQKLRNLYGTSHKIADWEITQLLQDEPQIILIGTGQSGKLEVDDDFIKTIKGKGIELIIEKTPEAIITYNNKVDFGKRINALIHTTC